jgi:hypothetical protein
MLKMHVKLKIADSKEKRKLKVWKNDRQAKQLSKVKKKH